MGFANSIPYLLPSAGGGTDDRRMLRESREAGHYVPGGGGEEVEHGAETNRPDLLRGLTFACPAG